MLQLHWSITPSPQPERKSIPVYPEPATARTWIVQPQRSLTWLEARRWLCVLSLIPASSGILSAFYGAPLVLPFAGLEIALLWAAFYWVNLTGRQREVIRLEGSQVIIEKGRDEPEEVHRFEQSWVRIELRPSPNRWHPSRLCFISHGREVTIGHFLTEGEREDLARTLINAIKKSR
ncbi:MAG: DUF2244 domain-containing protein [Gammaproteobacteria bacterium]|nr:DUF2244 domain-containing protein [Gammaproteobacteria bacterium]